MHTRRSDPAPLVTSAGSKRREASGADSILYKPSGLNSWVMNTSLLMKFGNSATAATAASSQQSPRAPWHTSTGSIASKSLGGAPFSDDDEVGDDGDDDDDDADTSRSATARTYEPAGVSRPGMATRMMDHGRATAGPRQGSQQGSQKGHSRDSRRWQSSALNRKSAHPKPSARYAPPAPPLSHPLARLSSAGALARPEVGVHEPFTQCKTVLVSDNCSLTDFSLEVEFTAHTLQAHLIKDPSVCKNNTSANAPLIARVVPHREAVAQHRVQVHHPCLRMTFRLWQQGFYYTSSLFPGTISSPT